MSRLDVVVFGASGFTGKHAAELLAKVAAQRGLTWAVAGRSRDKLLRVLQDISNKTGQDLSSTKVLVADVQDEKSVRDLCEQARVLVNCCGPYTLYGEIVVRAAIHSRTHYVDVSGEPNFIEMMQLRYDQAAREAGVYVISACGFESIPADLGVIFLQQNFGGILNSVECYVSPETRTQSVNSGTWDSFVYSLSHFNEIPAIRKKLYPTPLPKFKPELKSRFPVHKRSSGWCLPFPGNDSSCVYRTQRFFHEREGARPAHFKFYITFGSLFTALSAVFASVLVYLMSQFSVTRNILLKHPTIFSLGLITKSPADDVIRSVRYEFTFYGRGWDERDAGDTANVPPRKSVVAKVSGTNPGYGMTVAALVHCAVAILKEQPHMPPGGGVLTPGIAFAKTSLIKTLQENEIGFEIVHSKVHED